MLKTNGRFRGTYKSALYDLTLSTGGEDDWLTELEGVADRSGNEFVELQRSEIFVIIDACRPHACDTQRVIAVFSPLRRSLFGLARLSDLQWHSFGVADPELQAVAMAAYGRWAAAAGKSPFPLPAGLVQDVQAEFLKRDAPTSLWR